VTAAGLPVEAPADRPASGARSGAIIAAASLVATVANYGFLLVAGRVLGSDDYGALAALLGALTVILLPTGAVQLAVSREVSRRVASGAEVEADAFAWAAFRLALLATAPVVAICLALVPAADALLNIESAGAVAIAASGVAAAFVLPVALGVLQGYHRFHSVALLYLLPFALRLALFALVAAIGFRLGGAVYAAVFAGIVSAAVAVTLIEQPLRRGARAARPKLRPFLGYLGPVALGLIGIAVLTNADLLVAKARLSSGDAGAYAAASAFARVAFFLPATLLAVLFPRTAARQARGEETDDILGRSLLVVAAFCGLLTLFYGLAGRGLVHTSFGAEFASGGELLVPFTLAMTCYALANVLAGFHLSRGETRYAWFLAATVPVHLVVLSLVPATPTTLVWANAAVAAAALLAHELVAGSSLPALRAGARHLARGLAARRAWLVEGAASVAAAAALAVALTWPLAADLGSAFMGSIGADASGGIWWLWHLQQEGGYHLFGSTAHTLTGAPFGYEEFNGLNVQWLLPYYPAYLATAVVGEVAAYNLVVLSGLALSGAAMYLLARTLGCSPLVAAWAGLAYVIFPAHVARIEHGSLLHFEVLALTLLAVALAAARPTLLRFAFVGAATLAAWLTSGYFGVMAVVAAGAFAVAAAGAAGRGHRVRLVAGTAVAVVVATAAVGMLSTAAGVEVAAVRERNTFDLEAYGLRATELVVPPAASAAFGDAVAGFHAARVHSSNYSETANYLGLLTLLLALVAIVAAWRGRSVARGRLGVVAGLSTVVAVALLLALPSPFAGLTWTPSRVLWEVVPTLRVPSRWVAVAMTALVPLAAIGLERTRNTLERRVPQTRRRTASAALVVAAMAVTTAELFVPVQNKVTRTVPVPAFYDAVEQAPDGLLAEYPLRRSDVDTFWQRVHGRPLVGGAPWGTFANDVERTLVDPDAPGTAERLALLGVTAIVTPADAMDFASTDPPDVPRESWGPGYELAGRAEDTSVWRVTAQPAPALATLPSESFVEGVVDEDGFVGHPLTGQTGVLELWSPRAGVVRLVVDAVPQGATRTLEVRGRTGRVVFPLAGRTRVATTVRVPRGRSRLDLRIEPAQQAGEFPLHLSAPWTEAATGPPALVARPLRAPTSE
jgi:O-antigen/teichoic acid export membrane protein